VPLGEKVLIEQKRKREVLP